MTVLSLMEPEDHKGSSSNGRDAELGFRSVEFEVGLGHPLEMSRVQSKVCNQPLVEGHERHCARLEGVA